MAFKEVKIEELSFNPFYKDQQGMDVDHSRR